ncbi:MAG: ATP-binding protein, partial [bacterium]
GVRIPEDVGQKIDNLIRSTEVQKMLKKKKDKTVEIASPIDTTKTISLSYSSFSASQQLLIARDVSEQIAVNELRKSFVTNASHELRTPLSVVSGYLESLEEDKNLPKNMLFPIQSSRHQACRMQKILDELLYLSKLEVQAHQDDDGEWLDVGKIVSQLVTDFNKTKSNDLREISLDIADVKLRAVETEIFSLCQNLLSNAFKYSPDTSPIYVNWKVNEHGFGCLSVIDEGEGIAAKDISRITERFYRVNVARSRKVGGTGLGLSIVRHIIENHGGRFEIQSEFGKGSEFKACFPPYRLPR